MSLTADIVPVGHRAHVIQDIRAVTLLRHLLSVQLLICSLLLSVGVSLPAAGNNSIERQSGDTLERLVSTQLLASPSTRAALSGVPGDSDPDDNSTTLNQSALSYLRTATVGIPATTDSNPRHSSSPHQARAPPIR
ncbi:hypothetical protein QGM61_05905 [Pseudohongiella sp. SYSU M77423]|uniref:hypothetical protein n=1 Tax=Pseudohongiella sp. SYSU M77423 TaxID=3042312 RepID=UPI0024814478|nr:hypothetical protein [Pseudohongiella sp. SYSU M77423]MDH7943347.1 hypothetical protein [Pseudohongiella sp. SYSU M77423]